jgi:hypothetical protein
MISVRLYYVLGRTKRWLNKKFENSVAADRLI